MTERIRNLDWIIRILRDCERALYYGKITVSIEGGNVTIVKREETLKPPKS